MSYPLCYHGNKNRKIKTMNPAFKHHVEQLPADVRHLFLHKLRVCPVEEAWNVLFYARLTDTFSPADAVAYRESLVLPAKPSPEPPPVPPAPTDPSPSAVQHHAAVPDPLTPAPTPEPPTDPGLPLPQAAPVKRRGKVAHLPKELRTEVNLRLDDNHTYEAIASWLETQGHPGFNPTNLHNWKQGGFQDWLREQERLDNQHVEREWIADLARQSAPGEINQLSLQLFSSQIMDTLFGMDTFMLKQGLAANPRHYIALLNSVCRMNEQFANSAEYQAFLKQHRERQRGTGSRSTQEDQP